MNKIDIFISHAWRFHEEWKLTVDIIDSFTDIEWRNFSVPWHDPALRASTEIGNRSITNTLKSQIIPCHLCFILTDLYSVNGNIKWIDLAVEFSKEYKVPYFYIGVKNIEKFKKLSNFLTFEEEKILKIIKNYSVKK